MAEAVLLKIVDYLVPQILEKVGKSWGVEHELKELGNTVSALRAELRDAEELRDPNHQIQDWLVKMKDALCDAEDVLEEFNIEAMRRELRGHNEMIKKVRTFLSGSNQLAFKWKMNHKVKAVRERIEAINGNRRFYWSVHTADSQVERERRERPETDLLVHEGDIIGRDDDKKRVMDFLQNSDMNEDVSILPIVGIGGLGKTALAQCVYNDEMVSKHFNLKMWVCVSDNFDMKKIVKDMIACAKKEEPTEVAMDRLQSELRGAIDGKRYLLVLDDWWNAERAKWLSLRELLRRGARGSKILITTRLPSVARITGTTAPHRLGNLSESASLEVLMQIACCNEEEIQDPEKRDIGLEIATKCYGVPLVIRTVGNLLFFEKSKQDWLRFKECELSRVCGVISTPRPSYHHLPSHLKQCFAFCSLFPKDYEIKKQTLVNLWVAEGFIQRSNGSGDLEYIAHRYFMELERRNFFQDYHEDRGTCKMHDLVHDLACLVAGPSVGWHGIVKNPYLKELVIYLII